MNDQVKIHNKKINSDRAKSRAARYLGVIHFYKDRKN